MAHALGSRSANLVYPKMWAVVPAPQDNKALSQLRTLQLCFNTEVDKNFYRQNLRTEREFTQMIFEERATLPGQYTFKVILPSGGHIDLVDVVKALAALPGQPLTLFSQKQAFQEISRCAVCIIEGRRRLLMAQIDRLADRGIIERPFFQVCLLSMIQAVGVFKKADIARHLAESLEEY